MRTDLGETATYDEDTYVRLSRELHRIESANVSEDAFEEVVVQEVWPQVPRVPLPSGNRQE